MNAWKLRVDTCSCGHSLRAHTREAPIGVRTVCQIDGCRCVRFVPHPRRRLVCLDCGTWDRFALHESAKDARVPTALCMVCHPELAA